MMKYLNLKKLTMNLLHADVAFVIGANDVTNPVGKNRSSKPNLWNASFRCREM